ncbi:MAG TPA: DUF998 domain-containing protein [Ktedonobacteraceae bacterium]|nr:DUF998 domain-containing protein [Ktedonobacteraceae bacterium]
MQSLPGNKASDGLSAANVRQASAKLALVTIVGIALYIIIDVIAQLLPPHYNPITQAESDLAVGPYGYLMTINFVIRGVLSLALLIGFMKNTSASERSQAGLVLLGIWAVGAFLLALFPTDIPGSGHATLHGRIHLLVAFIAFVSVAIGELLLSLRFSMDERWRSMRTPALTIASLTLIALVLPFAGPFIGLGSIGGVLERLFLGLALLWILLVALRLRSHSISN